MKTNLHVVSLTTSRATADAYMVDYPKGTRIQAISAPLPCHVWVRIDYSGDDIYSELGR